MCCGDKIENRKTGGKLKNNFIIKFYYYFPFHFNPIQSRCRIQWSEIRRLCWKDESGYLNYLENIYLFLFLLKFERRVCGKKDTMRHVFYYSVIHLTKSLSHFQAHLPIRIQCPSSSIHRQSIDMRF